ncbi:MAG: BrnT family toxin [Geminicoccaceae bacterium]
MAVTWDETKRRRTLAERGLDFADAEKVFTGKRFTRLDDRRDYGEPRYGTAGYLDGRFVVITWTSRDGRPRIISMRYGHGQEEERYRARMDRSR